MSRIDARFRELRSSNRKAFIPFLTAGDPNVETTARLILELERAGADIIELGVPFSDPMADGPTIQRASERALRNGVNARGCLEIVREVRRESEIPILLFSYLNPLLALGPGLAGLLADAGVDGVLATDMVPEEGGEFSIALKAEGLDTIFLVAPTSTDERIRRVAEASTGFIYAVARTGVTGATRSLSDASAALANRVRRFTDLPVAVGFGISNPEQVSEVWKTADGAVVGSRIVSEIEANLNAPDLVGIVGALARWLVSGRAVPAAL
ncbi:MAG TPA: tryptophan synthase subunit alpha [Blastocatellia bacterium]|jgi:tryptophan synthase alpha chain|nr:tryptophan synthase subunit alpha [Blastocatellia bacterium]